MGIRILLVDDDTALAGMLREYLGAEGFEAYAVHNGEDGVREALSGKYSAVILDIMLPGLNGIEVLKRVRTESRIPILMLTAKGDDVDRVLGLEFGADDYLPKPFYSRELVARLRAVLRRTAESDGFGSSSPLSLSVGSLILSMARRNVCWGTKEIDLTASEFNMLALLMRVAGNVVSKDELSVKVLGRPREAYERSVDVHIGNLRHKLYAAAGDAIEVETVRGIGYALRCLE
jgi:two-component system OmpR family response regulator